MGTESEVLTLGIDINDNPLNQKLDAVEQKITSFKEKASPMLESAMNSNIPGYGEAMAMRYEALMSNLDSIYRTRKAIDHSGNSVEREDLTAKYRRQIEMAERTIADMFKSTDTMKGLTDGLGKKAVPMFTKGISEMMGDLGGAFKHFASELVVKIGNSLTDDELVRRFMGSEDYQKIIAPYTKRSANVFSDANMSKFLHSSLTTVIPQHMRPQLVGNSAIKLRAIPNSFDEMLPESFRRMSVVPQTRRKISAVGTDNPTISQQEFQDLDRLVRNKRWAADAAVAAGIYSKLNGKLYYNPKTTYDNISAMGGFAMEGLIRAAGGESKFGTSDVRSEKAWKSISKKIGNNNELDNNLDVMRGLHDIFGTSGRFRPSYYEPTSFEHAETLGVASGPIKHGTRTMSNPYAEYTLEMLRGGAYVNGKNPVVNIDGKWVTLPAITGPAGAKAAGNKTGRVITVDDFHTVPMRTSMLSEMVRATHPDRQVGHNEFSDDMIYVKYPKEFSNPYQRTEEEKQEFQKLENEIAGYFTNGYSPMGKNGPKYIHTRSGKTHMEFMKEDVVDDLGRFALGVEKRADESAEERARIRHEGLKVLANGAGEGHFFSEKDYSKAEYNKNLLATEGESLESWWGTKFGFAPNAETERLLKEAGNIPEVARRKIMREHGTPNVRVVVGNFKGLMKDENGNPMLDENGQPLTVQTMDGQNWADASFVNESFQGRTYGGKATFSRVSLNALKKRYPQLIRENAITAQKISELDKNAADYEKQKQSIISEYGDFLIPKAAANGVDDLLVPYGTQIVESVDNIKNKDLITRHDAEGNAVLDENGKPVLMSQAEINERRSRDYSDKKIFAKTTYDAANSSSRWLSKQVVNSAMAFGFRDPIVSNYFNDVLLGEVAKLNDEQYLRDVVFGGDQTVDLNSKEARTQISNHIGGMFERYREGERLMPAGVYNYGMAAAFPTNVINDAVERAGGTLTPEQQASALSGSGVNPEVLTMQNLAGMLGIIRFPATAGGNISAVNRAAEYKDIKEAIGEGVSVEDLLKNKTMGPKMQRIVNDLQLDPKGFYLAAGSPILEAMQSEDFDGDLNGYFGIDPNNPNAKSFAGVMGLAIQKQQEGYEALLKAADRTPEEQAKIKEALTQHPGKRPGGYSMFNPQDSAHFASMVSRDQALMGVASRGDDLMALISEEGITPDLAKAILDFESMYDVVSVQLKSHDKWNLSKQQNEAIKRGKSFTKIAKKVHEAANETISKEDGKRYQVFNQDSLNKLAEAGIDAYNLPSINEIGQIGQVIGGMRAKQMGLSDDIRGEYGEKVFDYDSIFQKLALPESVKEGSRSEYFVRGVRSLRAGIENHEFAGADKETLAELQKRAELAKAEIKLGVANSGLTGQAAQDEIDKQWKAIGGKAFDEYVRNGYHQANVEASDARSKGLKQLTTWGNIDESKVFGGMSRISAQTAATAMPVVEPQTEKLVEKPFVRPTGPENGVVSIVDKVPNIKKEETEEQETARLLHAAVNNKKQEKILLENKDAIEKALASGSLESLTKLSGIGEATAQKAIDALQSGKLAATVVTSAEEMKKPVETVPVHQIPELKEHKAGSANAPKGPRLIKCGICGTEYPETLGECPNAANHDKYTNNKSSVSASSDHSKSDVNGTSLAPPNEPPKNLSDAELLQRAQEIDRQLAKDRYNELVPGAQEFSKNLYGSIQTTKELLEGTPSSIAKFDKTLGIASAYESKLKEFKESDGYNTLQESEKRDIERLLDSNGGLVAKAGKDFSLKSMYGSQQLAETLTQAESKANGSYDAQVEALEKWDKKILEVQEDQKRLLEMSQDPKYSKELQNQFKQSADKIGQDLTQINTSRQNLGAAIQKSNQEAFDKQIENLENRLHPGNRYQQQSRQYQQQIASLRENVTKKHDAGLISQEAYDSDMKRLADLEKQTSTTALSMQQGFKAVGQSMSRSITNIATRFGRQLYQKALTEAKKFVVEYNRTMTEIQMITLKTDDQMSSLGDGLVAKAKELKVSIADISKSAATLYRQGLSDEEVDERLEVISKFSKVSGTKVDAATKLITVAMNTGLVTDPQLAADIVTALGDNAATNASEIEKGIEKAGAAAAADGTTFGQLAAMLTAITSTTQIGGSTAGRTLNTIFGRMNKIGTNELIYDENGHAISGSAVSNLLAAQGVRTYDEKGNKRSSYDVLYELSQKWDKMSDAEQQQIATAIAGTRQYSNFAAIMQGMSEGKVDQYMALVGNSSGIVDQKYEVYIKSLEASLTNLKNTFDELVKDLTEKGVLTGFLDGISGAIEGVDNLVNSMNGLGGVLVSVLPMLLAFAAVKAGLSTGNIPLALIGLTAGAVMFEGLNAIGDQKESVKNSSSGVNGVSYNEYAEQSIKARSETNRVDNLITDTKSLLAKTDRTDEETAQLKQNLTDLTNLFGYLGFSVEELTGSSEKAAKALNQISEINEENKKQNTLQEIQDVRNAILNEGSQDIINPKTSNTNDVEELLSDKNNYNIETKFWEMLQSEDPNVAKSAIGVFSSNNIAKETNTKLLDYVPVVDMFRYRLPGEAMTAGEVKHNYFVGDLNAGRNLIQSFIDKGLYDDPVLSAVLRNPGEYGLTLDDILEGKTNGIFTGEMSKKFFSQTSSLFRKEFSGYFKGPTEQDVEQAKTTRKTVVGNYSGMMKDMIMSAVGAPDEAVANALVKDFENEILIDGYENMPAESFFSLLVEKYDEFCKKIFGDDGSVKDVQPISEVYRTPDDDDNLYAYKGQTGLTKSEAYRLWNEDRAAAEEIEAPEIGVDYTYSHNGKTGLTYAEAEDSLHRSVFAAYAGEGVSKQGYYNPANGEHYYDDDEDLYSKYEMAALAMMGEDIENGKLTGVTKENFDTIKRQYQEKAITNAVRNGELVHGLFVNDDGHETFLRPEEVDKWVDKAAEDDLWNRVDLPTVEPTYSFNGESGLTWGEAVKKQNDYKNKNVGLEPVIFRESKVGRAVKTARDNAGVSKSKQIHADNFISSVNAAGVTNLQELLEAVERGEIENFDDVVKELGLEEIIANAYSYNSATGKITADDAGGAVFAKIMSTAASGSNSYAGIGENAYISSRQHGSNVSSYLSQFREEGVDVAATDEEMKAVLGDSLASKLIAARASGRMDEVSEEELRYARRLASNYSNGFVGLTAGQKLEGIKEVREAIKSGAYARGEYDTDIADQYMSQWSGWSEYAALLSKRKEGTLTAEDTARMKVLEQSLENFQKNAEISFEVEGVKQLEEAGKVADGTAAKIEKLKKGGKVAIDVQMQIHNEAYESGQKRAKLYGGTREEQDEAAMALLGMSREEYYANGNRDVNYRKALDYDQKVSQTVDADTWMELYRAEKTAEGRQIILDAAAKAGFIQSRDSSNQTFEYVGADLSNVGSLAGASRAYTEAEKSGMLDRILAGEERSTGEGGNSELYDAAIDYAGENTRELLRRIENGEEIPQWLQSASDAERRNAYWSRGSSMYATRNQEVAARQALAGDINEENVSTIASYLGMEDKQVKSMLEAGKGDEISDLISEKANAAFDLLKSEIESEFDIKLEAENWDDLTTELETATADADESVKQRVKYYTNMLRGAATIMTPEEAIEKYSSWGQEQKNAAAITSIQGTVTEGMTWDQAKELLIGEGKTFKTDADFNTFLSHNADIASAFDMARVNGFNSEVMNQITQVSPSAVLSPDQNYQQQYQKWLDLQNGQGGVDVAGLQNLVNTDSNFREWIGQFDNLQDAMKDANGMADGTSAAFKRLHNEMFDGYQRSLRPWGDKTDEIVTGMRNAQKSAKGMSEAAGNFTSTANKAADNQYLRAQWRAGKRTKEVTEYIESLGFDKKDVKNKAMEIPIEARLKIEESKDEESVQEALQMLTGDFQDKLNGEIAANGPIEIDGQELHVGDPIIISSDTLLNQFRNYLDPQLVAAVEYAKALGFNLDWKFTLGENGAVTATPVVSASTGSGSGLGSGRKSGSRGGGGGGGKSKTDKVIEEGEYRLMEAQHKVKMAQIKQEHYSFTNDYQKELKAINEEVGAQKGLAEVYEDNIAMYKRQQNAVAKYSEEWWKLQKQIRAAQEALEETKNTIEQLENKRIEVVQRKHDNEDAPKQHNRNMIDAYVNRFQTEYQSGGNRTESSAYVSWVKQKNEERKAIETQKAQNDEQIKEWKSLLAVMEKGTQAYNEVQQKIWSIQEENAQLENDLLQLEIDLNNARLERIAKVLQNQTGETEHEINLADTRSQIYQINRDYSGYRQEIAKQREQYTLEEAYYQEALDNARNQMATLTEGSAAWYSARDAVYEYEEALIKLGLTQAELDQALRESYLNEVVEKLEKVDTVNSQMLNAAQLEAERAKTIGNDSAYVAALEKEEALLEAQAQAERDNLQALMDLKNSGNIAEGTQEWDELLKKIVDVQNQIDKTEVDALAKANEVAAARLQNIMDGYKESIRDIQHELSILQNEQAYYKSKGELTNYGQTLNAERNLREQLLNEQRKTMSQLRAELETYAPGSDNYNKVLEELQKIEQEYYKEVNAANALAKAIQENEEAIRKIEIRLENTINAEIKKRIQEQKNMLAGEVNLQNTILDTIKKRYQQEWQLIKKDLDKKKQALQEEKSMIQDRVNARKQAEQQEDQYSQLTELQKQLAIIEADPTRSKEAKSLRKQIEDLQKQLSGSLADNIAQAEQKRLDDMIKGITDYQANHEEDLNEYLKDNNNFKDILDQVLGGTQEDFLNYMRENNETYQNATEEQRQQMEEGWHDTWLKMRGEVETYWEQVLQFTEINDENQEEMRQKFIEYMKEGTSYLNASSTSQKSMVYEWGKMFDDFVAAQKLTPINYEGTTSAATSQDLINLQNHLDNMTFKVDLDDDIKRYLRDGLSLLLSKDDINWSNYDTSPLPQFSSGGLVDFTGPAMVHGTPSKPEGFLSVEDTATVRALIDQLAYIRKMPIMSTIPGSMFNNSSTVGDVNITINQAEINSDQDIDELAKKIGRSFTRQLSRNGFNTANYAF